MRNLALFLLPLLLIIACQSSTNEVETRPSPTLPGELEETTELALNSSKISVETASALLKERYGNACGKLQSSRNRREIQALELALRRELWAASDCEQDSDCVPSKALYLGACCGLEPSVNRNADLTEINRLTRQLHDEVLPNEEELGLQCLMKANFPEHFRFCVQNHCI